jgi:hypothetical protein
MVFARFSEMFPWLATITYPSTLPFLFYVWSPHAYCSAAEESFQSDPESRLLLAANLSVYMKGLNFI